MLNTLVNQVILIHFVTCHFLPATGSFTLHVVFLVFVSPASMLGGGGGGGGGGDIGIALSFVVVGIFIHSNHFIS